MWLVTSFVPLYQHFPNCPFWENAFLGKVSKYGRKKDFSVKKFEKCQTRNSHDENSKSTLANDSLCEVKVEKDVAFCTLTQTFEVPLIPKSTISNQQSLLHGIAKVLFRWRRLRHPYVRCADDKIKAQRSHLTDSILPRKCCLHPRFLQPNSPFSLPQYCHGPWLSFDRFSYARISHRTTQYHIMPGSWALNTSTHKTGPRIAFRPLHK